MIPDPRVAANWVAFNAPLEGVKNFLYLDTHQPPIATTAIGIALPNSRAMGDCTWRKPDGTEANVQACLAEWQRVTDMPGGLVAERYRDAANGAHLHIDDEEIERLVVDRLEADADILAAFWPTFPTFPWQAQQALCSLAWAVGAGSAAHGLTGPEWPHLQAAVARQDWAACAVEGVLKGNAARNAANAALFRSIL